MPVMSSSSTSVTPSSRTAASANVGSAIWLVLMLSAPLEDSWGARGIFAGRARVHALSLQAPAELRAAPGRHGARGALLAELQSVRARVLQELLAFLALAGRAQEQPAEQPER